MPPFQAYSDLHTNTQQPAATGLKHGAVQYLNNLRSRSLSPSQVFPDVPTGSLSRTLAPGLGDPLEEHPMKASPSMQLQAQQLQHQQQQVGGLLVGQCRQAACTLGLRKSTQDWLCVTRMAGQDESECWASHAHRLESGQDSVRQQTVTKCAPVLWQPRQSGSMWERGSGEPICPVVKCTSLSGSVLQDGPMPLRRSEEVDVTSEIP